MKPMRGTPKTLAEAIANGLEEASTVIMMRREAEGLANETLPHVEDFMNQKFAAVLLLADHSPELEEMILGILKSLTGKDRPHKKNLQKDSNKLSCD